MNSFSSKSSSNLMVSRPELRDITPKRFRTFAAPLCKKSHFVFYVHLLVVCLLHCLVNESVRHFDFLKVSFSSPFLFSCAIRRFLSRTCMYKICILFIYLSRRDQVPKYACLSAL